MQHTILPKKGLDSILFGAPIEEVIRIMGTPTGVEDIENACDETTTIVKYEGITLFFEGENPTLVCIDITLRDSTLFGQRIFSLDERSIVKLMVGNGFYEQDIDTETWGERRITFNEGNIDFFFENTRLISVLFGK